MNKPLPASFNRLAIGRAYLVGIVGVLIGSAIIVSVLSEHDDGLTRLVGFGIEDGRTLGYAIERLGDVAVRDALGHDGKFFFIQAHDPFVVDPDEHAGYLDLPRYRSQRMFYPFLAGLGGLMPSSGIVWGLAMVSLASIFAGTVWLAAYSLREGLSPWLGLAFPLNPGVVHELTIDGAGVLAFALLAGALYKLVAGRHWTGVLLLVLAGLTRESMLVASVGVGLWFWIKGMRTKAVLAVALPATAIAGWGAYLRIRLPGNEGTEVNALDPPFVGVVKAFSVWPDRPAHLVVGVAVIVCLALLCRQVVRGRRDLIALSTVGFAALAVVLSDKVWMASYDISRAVAPALTAVLVNPTMLLLRRASTLTESGEELDL